MISKVELSKKQREIVQAENTAIYVKASAGSGKTRILTERVRYLLNRTRKKILALTFTNKAGKEIKERLSDIQDIDKQAFIGTFHGFCKSVLENHGYLIGFQKMPHIFGSQSDRLELIEDAISKTPSYKSKYKAQSEKEQKQSLYRTLNFIAKIKRELIDENEYSQHTNDENTILLYQNYQDILNAQNAIDFDDLLLKTYQLLTNYPKIAALYRRSFFAICIDEAQDLNYAQYHLLVALAGNEFTNIMMVGDPNQSIFHFNGSSPDYMDRDFVNDFNPIIFTLIENYRSSKAVLKAANKIFPDAECIPETVKEGLFEINSFKNEISEAQWVINKIEELIKTQHTDIEGETIYEKIAVLARTKYVFKQLETELNKLDLPYYYKMTPGAIRFESFIMQLFNLALQIKLNPHDRLHKQRLLDRLKIKNSKTSNLESITSKIKDNLSKNLITLVTKIREDGSNIKHLLEKFRDDLDIKNEDERSMIYNDINELIKHWHNYAIKTDNESLRKFKNAMALGQTHPLTHHTGITLSTVHTMKGQEFDIVFIIGLDDGTFPDYRAIQSGDIEMVQERNNLYVAFTRARRFLYVSWPQQRMMPWGESKKRKVSRFLRSFN